MTINGEATIYNHSNQILAISTTAKARSGKKSAIATHVLIRKIPEVSEMLETLVSVSCAKLSNEEYIVTRGPTNPLDLLIRLEIVNESLAAKKPLHFWKPS